MAKVMPNKALQQTFDPASRVWLSPNARPPQTQLSLDVREHSITMRTILAGAGVAFTYLIVSLVLGIAAGIAGGSTILYAYLLSLVLCFAIFFLGGRYMGARVFWPAAIAYLFLAVCSAFVVATIASESIVAFSSRMAQIWLLEFALAIIGFWVGVWSQRGRTEVVKSAP